MAAAAAAAAALASEQQQSDTALASDGDSEHSHAPPSSLMVQIQDDEDLRKTLGMTHEGTCYRHANQQVLRATGLGREDDHEHDDDEEAEAGCGPCPCANHRIPQFAVSISVHPCRVCESEYKAFCKRLETIANDRDITPDNVDDKVEAVQRHRKSFAKVIGHVQALHTDLEAFAKFTENWGQATSIEANGNAVKRAGRPPRSKQRRPSTTSVTAMDSDSTASENENDKEDEDEEDDQIERQRQAVTHKIMVWIRAFTRRVDQVKEWEVMDNEQNKRVAKFKLQQLEAQLKVMQALVEKQKAQLAEQKTTIQKQERTISQDLKRIKMIATKRANSQRDLMSPPEGGMRRKSAQHLGSSPKQTVERKSSLPVPASGPMLPRGNGVPAPPTSSSSPPLPPSSSSSPPLPKSSSPTPNSVEVDGGASRRPPKANISDLTMHSATGDRKPPPSSSISDLTLQSVEPPQEAPPRIPMRHPSNPTELKENNMNIKQRVSLAPSTVKEADDEHSSPASTNSKTLPLSPREEAPRPPVRYASDKNAVELLQKSAHGDGDLEQIEPNKYRNGRVLNGPPTPPLRQPSQDDDTLLSVAAVSTTSTSATVPTYGNSDPEKPDEPPPPPPPPSGDEPKSSPKTDPRGNTKPLEGGEVEFTPTFSDPNDNENAVRLSDLDPAQVLAALGAQIDVPPPPSVESNGEVVFVPPLQNDDQLRLSTVDPANVLGAAYSRTPNSHRKSRERSNDPEKTFYSPEDERFSAKPEKRSPKIRPERSRSSSGDSKGSSKSKKKRRSRSRSHDDDKPPADLLPPPPPPPPETESSKKEEIQFDPHQEFGVGSNDDNAVIPSFANIAFDANPLLLEASQALAAPIQHHPRRRSMDHYGSVTHNNTGDKTKRRSTMGFSPPSVSEHRRKSMDVTTADGSLDIQFNGASQSFVSPDESKIFEDRVFLGNGAAEVKQESSYDMINPSVPVVAAQTPEPAQPEEVLPATVREDEEEEDDADDDDDDDEFPELENLTHGPFDDSNELAFRNTANLSPVSALTTGSYLLEQQLGGKSDMFDDEGDGGPRKGLGGGGGGRELPMEQDLDLDDDTTTAGGSSGLNSGDQKPLGRHLSRNSINRNRSVQSIRAGGGRGGGGENRNVKKVIKVDTQRVQDRYGDGGNYTGTILLQGNLPHGEGIMLYDNNRQYEGQWRDGRWHGFGRWVNPNGDCYKGTFVYDARHGSGIYTWKNGNVYQGEFFEDKRQGKGKFNFANGNVYAGDFVNGVFEGQGRYDFEGGHYDGHWKSGRYHGTGYLLFSDNSSYKGDFLDGVAHGRGEERGVDGSIRRGIWENGKPVDGEVYS